jgi:signal transduction histidine kinase
MVKEVRRAIFQGSRSHPDGERAAIMDLRFKSLLLGLSPRNFRRSAVVRYGFAAAAVAVAALAGVALQWAMGPQARPLTVMVLAVVVAGGFGGLGPAVFATALATLVADIFLVEGSAFAETTLVNLLIFVAVSLFIASFYEALRASRASEAHLREEVAAADEIVGFVSHELRNPAAVITGSLSLLSRLPQVQQDEDLKAIVSNLKEEADELVQIIEHLLLLSANRPEAAASREPVLLPRVIESQVRHHRFRHPRRPVEIVCPTDCALAEANEESIRLILRNLLENAEKYSPDPLSPIEIDVRRLDSLDEIAVTVRDRGLGIGEHEAEVVFESFYRSEAARATKSGFGLGLAVCKRLAEAGGGRVWATPRPGGGAEFGFTVPALKLHGEEDAP